jgi:homopolymeric O-antigen transport system permease protein
MTPQYGVAMADILEGVLDWRMWGRLGSQEVRRRYRRTVIGPFWTSISLGIFIFTLGILWAQLWKQNPKTYLPFLCAGMLAWALVAAIITEGCSAFVASEGIIKQLPFPYTVLSCTVVWRNVLTLFHNVIIFVLVALYASVPFTWSSLLVVPALGLIFINGIWVVTLLALLCSRYRDIQQVITSILQVSMFVTPIFWAPEQLGVGFKKFVDYNILYHYVDILRSPMLGRAPATWSWVVTIACTLIGWTVTLVMFSRFRRRVAYWL